MKQGFTVTEEALEQARKLFSGEATFIAGATDAGRFPPEGLPEIAFAGRSNVGKSSLINGLCNRKSLARSSNTPGRTQQINFFDIGGVLQLADMPGYGYAKTDRSKVHAWNAMVLQYLRGRGTLKRLCVLVDARHGILAADEKALKLIDDVGIPYLVVLTKADKVKKSELDQVVASVEKYLESCKCAFPAVHVTSAGKGTGLPELRAFLFSCS